MNQGGGGDVFDPFSMFFGGGQQRHEEKKGPSVTLKVRVTLEDVYNGKELEVTYTRQALCPHCRGSGAESHEDVHECSRCKGKGFILQKQQIAPGFV